MSDIRSVPGGCSRFSRCCYLRIDLSSHLFGESRAPGLSRSHLDSAVELGSSYPILSHRAYPFPVLIFFIAGLLSLALRARRPLGAYRIPSRPAFSSHLRNGITGKWDLPRAAAKKPHSGKTTPQDLAKGTAREDQGRECSHRTILGMDSAPVPT